MFDRHIPSKKTTKTRKALATSNNPKFLTLDQCLLKISALFTLRIIVSLPQKFSPEDIL